MCVDPGGARYQVADTRRGGVGVNRPKNQKVSRVLTGWVSNLIRSTNWLFEY